ncbi:MAG: protein kinase [Acidobacteriia bacterium]|nr:protein kinase [Terriglobia bacterium]
MADDKSKRAGAQVTSSGFGQDKTFSGQYAAPAPALSPGTVLGGRYQILELLGEGGMGAVYKAKDVEVDRLIALKLIRPELASNPAILQRFKQELVLSRQVTHRNVVRIYDLGEAEGVKFITMEYVEGEDLRSLLRQQGKFPVGEAIAITEQMLAGLQAAHAEGVIHRDLKPGNIMRDPQGRVVVMDFGLARTLESGGMTQTGMMVGTMEYMSPEQAQAKPVDVRSDLYTVGLIFYELLSGNVPFKANSALASLLKRTQERAVPVAEVERSVPHALSSIVSKCLERDPSQRYQAAQQILDDLAAFQGRTTGRSGVVVAGAKPNRMAWIAAPVAVALLVIAVALGWFLTRGRGTGTAAPHAPVSVLVADFENKTSDGVFDGTLEPAFGLALEGASFISSFNRAQARKIAAQLKPGTTAVDEPVARLIAVREGVSVIITGSITAEGGGYKLRSQAEDGVTGKVISTQEAQVQNKDAVLKAVGGLAAAVRKSLGDTTPESVQKVQAETFTSSSLEAAHEYARAQDLQWAGNWGEAEQHYKRAIELDPNMGRAYAGLAATAINTGRRSEAEKYYQSAMALVGRMSDREKYRTRGGYYLTVREPQKAIEEYSALVKQYPADASAYGNLALAYFYMRDMPKALQEGRHSVEVSPKNLLQRDNLALYAVYAGDFATGAREARTVIEQNPSFTLAYNSLAMAQMGSGEVANADQTYQKLEGLNARGASMASLGRADVALFHGRAEDAIPLLEKGIAADLANKDKDGAAIKYIVLAQAHLLAGHAAAAQAAADKAVTLVKEESVLYSAGQVYLETGQLSKASQLAAQLASRVEPEPQIYGKLLEGETSLKRKDPRLAIQLLQAAQKITDTWLGHYDLGRAYLDAGMFTEADSEFELCLRRKGEASAVFLDDVPTFRIVPPLYYYLGRVQEGLKSPTAADSYKTFVSLQEKGAGPLLSDAQRRLNSH